MESGYEVFLKTFMWLLFLNLWFLLMLTIVCLEVGVSDINVMWQFLGFLDSTFMYMKARLLHYYIGLGRGCLLLLSVTFDFTISYTDWIAQCLIWLVIFLLLLTGIIGAIYIFAPCYGLGGFLFMFVLICL